MKTQGAQLAKGELTDISSMADGVRQLAQYQEQAGKLAQHMQMADACMDRFQKKKLHQLGLLEQTMATGVTDEGKKPKLAQLTNDLDQLLRSEEVGLQEKVLLL
jgi:syntaxin-binding protein 1